MERHAGKPKRGKQYIDLKEEKDSLFDFAQIASLSLQKLESNRRKLQKLRKDEEEKKEKEEEE